MNSRTTITTASGDRVEGEVVTRSGSGSDGSFLCELMIGMATCGLSAAMHDTGGNTTVKDSGGNFWTGKE